MWEAKSGTKCSRQTCANHFICELNSTQACFRRKRQVHLHAALVLAQISKCFQIVDQTKYFTIHLLGDNSIACVSQQVQALTLPPQFCRKSILIALFNE